MSNSQSLKSIGLKATFPRLKILDLFEKSNVRHLSAEGGTTAARYASAPHVRPHPKTSRKGMPLRPSSGDQ